MYLMYWDWFIVAEYVDTLVACQMWSPARTNSLERTYEGTVVTTKDVGGEVSMVDMNCQTGGRAGTRAKQGRSGVKLLSSPGIFFKIRARDDLQG